MTHNICVDIVRIVADADASQAPAITGRTTASDGSASTQRTDFDLTCKHSPCMALPRAGAEPEKERPHDDDDR